MLSDLAQGMFMFGGSYMKNYFGLQKAAKELQVIVIYPLDQKLL